MKLQLDTTVSFHKVLNRFNDKIPSLYRTLRRQADSAHASTFTKKEFAFSLISDCCAFQASLFSKKSFLEAYSWIDKYGYFRKRFGPRIHTIFADFILNRYGTEILDCDVETKDKIIAKRLFEYLRITIPELWDRFDEGLELPLDDRTQCPFACQGPIELGSVFTIKTKTARHPCNGLEGCALANMLNGKDGRRRAISLLKDLQAIPDDDKGKTEELKKIQTFLEKFYQDGAEQSCYEMCNKGIGDAIIAIETLPDRILIRSHPKTLRRRITIQPS